MRRILSVGSVLGAVLLVFSGVVGSGAAVAKDPLPVDYNFLSGIPQELLDPGGSLPGSNDWSCTPSPQHPRPVILMHALGGGAQTNWGTYAPLLANNGYCVFALTYGALELPWPLSAAGGLDPIEDSAAVVGAFAERVLAATGATQVDFVSHSAGNLVAGYWVKFLGGSGKVDKHVALAPMWDGTDLFGAGEITAFTRALGLDPLQEQTIGALCMACLQIIKGSNLLTEMHKGGIAVPGVTYTNIMSRYEELIWPYTSGYLSVANATNIVVQDTCEQDLSEHAALAGSRRAAMFVLNALDPEHPRPVPCEFTPPFTG